MRHATIVISLAIPLVCCQPDSTVRERLLGDTTGLTLAAQSVWDEGTAWTVAEQPELHIGEVEGDSAYLFAKVKGAIQLMDGTIVVADAGNHELRYYSHEGVFLLSTGGDGEGPGEFQGILWIDECVSNTVHVYDFVLDRVSIFSLNGELIESFRIESPPGMIPSTMKCQLGGEFVIVGRPGLSAAVEEGPYRPDQTIAFAGSNGLITHILGSLPGSERYKYPTSATPRPLAGC